MTIIAIAIGMGELKFDWQMVAHSGRMKPLTCSPAPDFSFAGGKLVEMP